MKRSEINQIIRRFECLLDTYKFMLPEFLSFTPEEWMNPHIGCCVRSIP